MELKDAFEFFEKLMGVPFYYTEAEEQLSVSSSVIAAFIGYFVLRSR
jgi:hypothetical protein